MLKQLGGVGALGPGQFGVLLQTQKDGFMFIPSGNPEHPGILAV
jgi:hypothetical protein